MEIITGDLYDSEAHTLKTILEEPWHHLPEAEVIDFLETASDRGLDTFEVGHRHEQFGPNTITQKKGRSPLVLFLLQFHQPLVYILLGAAAVTGVLREWVDTGVIFGVVLVNAVIGFIQEAKAVKAIEKIDLAAKPPELQRFSESLPLILADL